MALLAALTVTAVPAQAATATANDPAVDVFSLTETTADSGTVGQSLPMTISATNVTANTMASVRLGAVFPMGAVKVVAPLPAGVVCNQLRSGGLPIDIFCDFGALQPGGTLSISLAIQPQIAGPLELGAVASGDIGGGVFSVTATQLSIPIAPAPTDVQVSGSASTGSPARGANYFYTFQVKDGGSQPAFGVTFTDNVPAELTLVSASTNTGAPCTLANGTVTCTLGDIAVGAQVNVTVNVTAPTTPMTLTDTGSASDTNGDTQPGNNAVSVTVQIK
jgi:uncharacterized repeat protein (TIGR01451 family)